MVLLVAKFVKLLARLRVAILFDDRSGQILVDIPISETVSLASMGLNEAWLQEQIWDNPTCIGLGDLEGVTKERTTTGGGRLDLLLKNPVDDSMYEVEVMLGDTDPSHIIRTIEYWDLIKRKWPQRQHFAVLIAERITKRFFNVIQILSGSVPLIAIQVNVIKSPSGHSLHFTKILDVYEEADDESTPDGDSYDEAYWVKKSNDTLRAAQRLFEITSPVYENARLGYCKHSINIVRDGYNQMLVRSRSGGNVLIELRYGAKRDEIAQLLEGNSIQYNDKYKHFVFAISIQRATEAREMFSQIALLNNKWWTDSESGGASVSDR